MVLLGENGLLKEIRHNILIGDWCGGLPFQWNQSESKLEMKSKPKISVYSARLAIGTIYFAMVVFQVIHVWKRGSLMVITHNIMFSASAALTFDVHLVNYIELPNIVELSNCFINYERRQEIGRKAMWTISKCTTADHLVRLMFRLLTYTGVSMPIIYHMDILRNPCFPLYLGYWLSDSCHETKLGVPLNSVKWSAKEIGTRLGITLLSYINWSMLMSGCLFMISLELILHGHSLRSYITAYGRYFLANFRIDENTRKTVLLYRQLQILSTQYRINYSRYMMGGTITCIVAIQVICLYNTISLFSGRDRGGSLGYNLLYMWTAMVCLSTVILVFGSLADVYNVSNRVLKNLTGKVELKKNKWFRKWLKSCPLLRVYFGGTNYLDRLTPLTLEQFVIDQTASLLLLKR